MTQTPIRKQCRGTFIPEQIVGNIASLFKAAFPRTAQKSKTPTQARSDSIQNTVRTYVSYRIEEQKSSISKKYSCITGRQRPRILNSWKSPLVYLFPCNYNAGITSLKGTNLSIRRTSSIEKPILDTILIDLAITASKRFPMHFSRLRNE